MTWLLFSTALALPGPDSRWEPLQTDGSKVECTQTAGEPWCRSTAVVHAPIAQVAEALEDMAGQQDHFDSVRSIRVLAPDTMHVVLDYPGALADRDYVARYTRMSEGSARIYRWEPVEHPEAPPTADVVRLPRFGGEWRLEPHAEGTRVTFTWQAEVAGSFPSWAVGIARRRVGHEALADLARARNAELRPLR